MLSSSILADTHYVSLTGGHVPPYTNWAMAATNIQAAVDVALAGETVVVTNGVYSVGGRVKSGSTLTNRVLIDKAVTVRSVNGRLATSITGNGIMGDGACRAAYVGSGALLSGFTLSSGTTRTNGSDVNEQSGAGAWCEIGGIVENCLFVDNAAAESGGGLCGGVCRNSLFLRNQAGIGGGAYAAELRNCTLTGNKAWSMGGGAAGCTGINCVVYFNVCDAGANHWESTFSFSCTTPSLPGTGNLTNDPGLATTWRLAADSPCVGAGASAAAGGVDLDGEVWRDPPSMGTDEPFAAAMTGAIAAAISITYTQVAVGFSQPLRGSFSGAITGSTWEFGDGVAVTNQGYATHAWNSTGLFSVLLRVWNAANPAGVTATARVQVVRAPDLFVKAGAFSFPPFTNWAAAAGSIQAAIDSATVPGTTIWVTNGSYVNPGALTNGIQAIVAVTKPLAIRSVNGPGATTITPGFIGPDRGVYLTNGAALIGFTVSNCQSGADNQRRDGGGVWCEPGAMLSNCIVRNCRATGQGGGVFRGTLNNCTLQDNVSSNAGGGACASALQACGLARNTAPDGGGAANSGLAGTLVQGNSATNGGGAFGCDIRTCQILSNTAYYGGGCFGGRAVNTIITRNAAHRGGGARDSELFNCTVTANDASFERGGLYGGSAYNSIVYFNTAGRVQNHGGSVGQGGVFFAHSCTTPYPGGTGNLSNQPQLVSGYRLATNSPCVGAGTALYSTGRDVDDQPWATPPSMGADEPAPGLMTGTLSASVSFTHAQVVAGQPAELEASITGLPGGLQWDFGDGLVETNAFRVSHTWNAPGTYLVVLRTWNESFPQGISFTTSVQVILQPVLYVARGGGDVAPYDTWAKAARTIQQAVDAALPGSLVLVSNGEYAAGGAVVFGGVSNRVAVSTPLAIRSVNGPFATAIQGSGPSGSTAARCLYLCAGSSLSGFTLTNGHTRTDGDPVYGLSGGAVILEDGATVSNCMIYGNTAQAYGGGTLGGTVCNSVLTENRADAGGGGSYLSRLVNCSVLHNYSTLGAAGLQACEARNAIVEYNLTGPGVSNHALSVFAYSCTTPAVAGSGNLSTVPRLATAWRLATNSPCLAEGNPADADGLDIDRESWPIVPPMGADYPLAAGATGTLSAAILIPYTQVTTGYTMWAMAQISGRATGHAWSFGDGTTETNLPFTAHAWSQVGTRTITLRAWNLSNPGGVVATAIVEVRSGDFYVSPSGSKTKPYDSWAKAAADIQDAVDEAPPGAVVWVTNGVYGAGGKIVAGSMMNRVAIDKPLTVTSVNGPGATTIRGSGPLGTGAVRGAYLAQGATLSGFTVSNGYTGTTGDWETQQSGGGLWLSMGAQATNCLVVSNRANQSGGGVFGPSSVSPANRGRIASSTVTRNLANQGGGLFRITAERCRLTSNRALYEGGAVFSSDLINSVLWDNSASHGGGAYLGTLKGCSVAMNVASNQGGGIFGGDAQNCIVYSNRSPVDLNYTVASAFSYSCTTPTPMGASNISMYPRFENIQTGTLNLQPSSPCIDGGLLSEWITPGMKDLEGRGRMLGAAPDMGAIEFRYEMLLRAYLLGPYLTNGSMAAAPAGALGTNSPYIGAKLSVSSVPTSVVDWVLLSMRPTPTNPPSELISAFLLSDGSIVTPGGGAHVGIETKGEQYLVLQHRNHLAVMTAAAISNRAAVFDFSTNALQVRGGTNAMQSLGGGRWGLFPADADGDGVVSNTDEAIRGTQQGR